MSTFTGTPSIRQRILEAVLERMRSITPNGGYATDAGQRVYLGEAPDLGPDDPVNAIVINLATSTPRESPQLIQERLPIVVAAHARADLDQPWAAAEELLADIMRAMESGDRTLGVLKGQLEIGETAPVEPRETGMSTVGVGITYYAPYMRRWGSV